jgi:hypothetical protein
MIGKLSASLPPMRADRHMQISSAFARPDGGKDDTGRQIRKDRAMMFLLRTALWTSLALALLPSLVPTKSPPVAVDVGAEDVLTAASQTIADLGGLCERRPEACATGAQFAAAFWRRTQAGAKIV